MPPFVSVYLDYEPFPHTGQEAFWEACGFRKGPEGWYRSTHVEPHPITGEPRVVSDTPIARHAALVGPAGIGKTMTGTAAMIMNAIEFPSKYLILAPTFQNHMKMTTLPEYEYRLEVMDRQFRRQYKKPLVRRTADGAIFHKTDREINLMPTVPEIPVGSTLFYRGTDDVDYLYGPTLGGIHFDEPGLMVEDAATIGRDRLRAGVGAQQAIYTFTPKGSKRHWTSRDFGPQLAVAMAALERGEIGIGNHPTHPVFTMRAEDNRMLTEEELAERRVRAEQSRRGYQEYHGVWLDEGGLIFEMFNPTDHVRAMPADIRLVRYAGGIDFGLSSPTVVIVVAEDSNGRRWWCREFSRRQCSDLELLTACRKYMDEFPGIRFFADPHSPEWIKRLRQNYAIPVWAAKPDVDARVSIMWEFLAPRVDGIPGIRFTPECVDSIAEVESWSWKPTRSGGGVVTYDDVEPHAHWCDAGGYAMVALGKGVAEPVPCGMVGVRS